MSPVSTLLPVTAPLTLAPRKPSPLAIPVLGCDPSLSNFGFADAQVIVHDFAAREIEIRVTAIDMVHTEKQSTKKNVRQNSDDLRRAREVTFGFHKHARAAKLVFVEVPHGSQSSRASLSAGVCVGVLAGSPRQIIEVSAEEVKLASVGRKTATKMEIIHWAHDLYPELAWIPRSVRSKKAEPLADENEHMADAIAAIYAGVRTEAFRQIFVALQLAKASA